MTRPKPAFIAASEKPPLSESSSEVADAPAPHVRAASHIACMALACLLNLGCQSEERVISARGGLYGLPGAQSGIIEAAPDNSKPNANSQVASGPWDNVLRAFPGYEAPATPTDDPSAEPLSRGEALGLRRVNRDGSVTLFARSPSDVMYHVMTTLENKEYELLLDQVIAEGTKSEYRNRGRDPNEAVEYLVKRRDDIAALFATFPMGDQTPGVQMQSIGRNIFRLTAPVAMTQELRLHTFDVVIERGQFRLLMIR
jgi:hypothetical protein